MAVFEKEEQRKAGGLDLLEGKILPTLAKLALPIMATAFVQMAYNLTDMAWIGFLGADAVAAIGAAGMYTWLSQGVVSIAKMGGQVCMGQSIGAGRMEDAAAYLRGALQLCLMLAAGYALLCLSFTPQLIGFFGISDAATADMAVVYMRITCGLIVFPFLNQTLTGLYTSVGDSRTPFLANCIGLIGNMIFDPVLIFGIGPFPRMGVAGAAAATVSAQAVVTLVLLWMRGRSRSTVLRETKVFCGMPFAYFPRIFRIGLPASLQTMAYCGISMVLTRLAAMWGDTAIAVQRVGSQIESIAWMTCDGFAAAVNAFVAQNYGAGHMNRVKRGYLSSLCLMGAWGLITTGILYFGAGSLVGLFLHDPALIPEGINYLRIISYGEMFMCLELVTVGALSGLGRTGLCSVLSMSLTGARIPIALILSSTALGLSGVWWAFTVSSTIKGIVFTTVFLILLHKLMRKTGLHTGACSAG